MTIQGETRLYSNIIPFEQGNSSQVNLPPGQGDSAQVSLPTKIFICEDADVNTINFWKNLLIQYGIQDIFIRPSGGCTSKDAEIWINGNKSTFSGYDPKVFRETDSDGLTEKQKMLIYEKYFKNIENEHYKFEFLPVNELENFAVILDKKIFNSKYWKLNLKEIEKKFENTAEATCRTMVNKFRGINNQNEREQCLLNFQSENGYFIPLIQEMRESAKLNRNRLFPGKDICSKINNYDAESRLLQCPIKEHPRELFDFMTKLRSFFES